MTFTLNLRHDQGEESRIYKDILPDENPDDRVYVEILGKVLGYTMTVTYGADSTYALFQMVKYLVQNRIPGDIVECGVWRGGSMMLIAYALQAFGDTSRQLYLYDTFAGMTEPDDVDIDFDGNAMKPVWTRASQNDEVIGYGGSLEDVMANLAQTGYPEAQTHFIAGDVMQTIPSHLHPGIALLRLDTDWYRSTLHELNHLYPLVAPHGVVIIDDYGWCRGARKATDEFFRDQAFKPVMHRVDQSVRIIVKPAL